MLGREHPEYWRIFLRSLLRDASYLPDPVARRYMHDWVMQRFRTVRHRKQTQDSLKALDKTARATTQLLRKAQAGRLRALNKVLFMSYGRTGRRRHELLAEMLAEPVPADTEAVRHVVMNKKTDFGDDWRPPAMVMALLKSQINNPEIQQRRPRPQVKTLAPSIPSQNSWAQPMPRIRKVNLRRKWYQDVLDSLLPPLPDNVLRTLDGLVDGTVRWAPVKRRTPAKRTLGEDEVGREDKADQNLLKDLTLGLAKEGTFSHEGGRAHDINYRFMRHNWRRVSALVPRISRDETWNKWDIWWDRPKPAAQYAFTPKDSAKDMFSKKYSDSEPKVDAYSPRHGVDAPDVKGDSRTASK
ncbi:hypothetical protein N7474_001646 [Penicillium riverlandense]|uniref:uncharacterized protein n=1 Tax=Penicillium riverlandense TaxID=1903569 RepID=UPI002547D82A|nr:uncharacterized protein N7474_001646 [Penicillium riverlandense]KAJ5833335.1 hypothetical protein N7474_001646 [Penicillium riverlandense]